MWTVALIWVSQLVVNLPPSHWSDSVLDVVIPSLSHIREPNDIKIAPQNPRSRSPRSCPKDILPELVTATTLLQSVGTRYHLGSTIEFPPNRHRQGELPLYWVKYLEFSNEWQSTAIKIPPDAPTTFLMCQLYLSPNSLSGFVGGSVNFVFLKTDYICCQQPTYFWRHTPFGLVQIPPTFRKSVFLANWIVLLHHDLI